VLQPVTKTLLRLGLVVICGAAALGLILGAVPMTTRVHLANGDTVSVHAPALWSRLPAAYGMLSFIDPPNRPKSAMVFYGPFEQPVLFVPGKDHGQLLCVFDFDIGLRVVAFSEKQDSEVASEGQEIHTLVKQSEMHVEMAGPEELHTVLRTLRQATDRSLRAASVPTLDLVLFRTYASRDNLIAGLELLEKRTR
jgi:hypothetical protein